MTVQNCFPAAGTVRADDERIIRLYHNASHYIDRPCLWEGLFRVACLVCSKPAEEPVSALIVRAGAETEDGSFEGSFSDQIYKARALYALFEYNTDRRILTRIAEWLRFVEIEFDALAASSGVLYSPADLMELLVRFYQITGIKSALRISTRLRAAAFDWTTALHTFQQSIPIAAESVNAFSVPDMKPEEIDYEQKEMLVNHAEMLADGVRYTLFSGLFSGHGLDLSSGETVWNYLLKHHHALCGGTTGNPFLHGDAPDQPVSNRVICAWGEALAACMTVQNSAWAAEELTRIVFNGLDDCLNHSDIRSTQMINTVCDEPEKPTDEPGMYARLTRAAASAFHHAVSITENGFIINYLLRGRFMLMIRKQTLVVKTDDNTVTIYCKTPVSVLTGFYLSSINPCTIRAFRGDKEIRPLEGKPYRKSTVILTDTVWHEGDRIEFIPDEKIVCEDTHHQGIAFLFCNRILCLPVSGEDFAKAICGTPVRSDGKVTVMTAPADQWRLNGKQPHDIPVLPEIHESGSTSELQNYSMTRFRISMFPRAR